VARMLLAQALQRPDRADDARQHARERRAVARSPMPPMPAWYASPHASSLPPDRNRRRPRRTRDYRRASEQSSDDGGCGASNGGRIVRTPILVLRLNLRNVARFHLAMHPLGCFHYSHSDQSQTNPHRNVAGVSVHD
jgi:hypothetical protein